MRTPRGLCAAILLLLLKYNAVLAFTLSAASNTAAVGQTFGVSWTSKGDDPEDVDICLSTNSVFLRVGSIHRSNLLQGNVQVTVGGNISPGTYTLGIRVTGCAFLLAQDINAFVVTALATTTSSTSQTTRSQIIQTTSSSRPPATSSKTSSTSTASTKPTSTGSSTGIPLVQKGSTSTAGSATSSGSATSITPDQSQTSSSVLPTVTSPDTSPTPSSGALGKTKFILGTGTSVQLIGCLLGFFIVVF